MESPEPDYVERMLRSAYSGEHDASALGPPESVDLPLPARLGRYVVVDRIGIGGIGEIYRVVDPVLERTVALKLLQERFLDDHAMREAFEREARAAGSLEHPGILPIHESGTLPDGRPYFTMRIVDGRTLAESLADEPARERPAMHLLEALCTVARTLAFAHAQGIVHGDLKPQNVMLGAFGEVQVIDWGFARPLLPPDAAASGESAPGPATADRRARVLGTPAYMSPEQARGDVARIDARTDVFGLGALLFELLTGSPPYRGASRRDVLNQAIEADPSAVAGRLDACGGPVEIVLLARRCLAREPERRPRDAAEVAAVLTAHLVEARERARRAEIAATSAAATAALGRRRLRLVVASALSVLAAGAVVSFVTVRSMRERAERRELLGAQVDRAITAATIAFERAAAAGPRLDSSAWQGAVEAAGSAVLLARGPDADAEQRAAAEALAARAVHEAESSAVAARALVRLDALQHLALDDRGGSDVDAAFAELYRSRGIDVDGADFDAAVAGLRADRIADALTLGLDGWARSRLRSGGARAADWRVLVDLAIASDPDRWRCDVRAALLAGDSAALEGLAERAAAEDLPAASRLLLAHSLALAGRPERALREFAATSAAHPDHFWACHDHAASLQAGSSSVSDRERVRLYSMALAVRPDDPHIHVDLARAWSMAGDLDAAEASADRALALAPDSGRALLIRGMLHRARGRIDLARDTWRRALSSGEGRAGLPLAEILDAEGRLADAIEAVRATVAALPEDVDARKSLGRLLLAALDPTRAAEQFDAALRAAPGDLEASLMHAYARAKRGSAAAALDSLREARARAANDGNDDLVRLADAMIPEVETIARVAALLAASADAPETLFGDDVASAAIFDHVVSLLVLDRPLAAARSARRLIEREGPESGLGLGFTAARAAARLALGEGRDATGLATAERSAWLAQAALWLDADLAEVERREASGSLARARARATLDAWRLEPALARLSERPLGDESGAHAAWRRTWERLAELRAVFEHDTSSRVPSGD